MAQNRSGVGGWGTVDCKPLELSRFRQAGSQVASSVLPANSGLGVFSKNCYVSSLVERIKQRRGRKKGATWARRLLRPWVVDGNPFPGGAHSPPRRRERLERGLGFRV